MAAAAPPADQAVEYMQKLNLNSEAKTEVTDKGKKYNSGVLANGLNKPYERSVTPLQQGYVDPSTYYHPNAYPSPYYGSDWLSNKDGFEMTNGYGYAPYSPYHPPGSPVPNLAHEWQMYYQYLSSYYQPSTPSSGSNAPNQAKVLQPGVSTSKAADQISATVDASKLTNEGGNLLNMPKPIRPNHHKSTWLNASTLTDVKSKYTPGSDGNNVSNGRNQSILPCSNTQPRPNLGMNQAGLVDRMYPNRRIYNQYANLFRNAGGYGLSNYDRKFNSRGWMGIDSRWKSRGCDNGCFSNATGYNGLNELNRGPRTKPFKNQMELEQNKDEKLSAILDLDQYNKEDFPEVYCNAKFFIIKSYSEDDVHKSVKYGVWASTPNGNKKLDAAYREAQEVSGGCPVFLFFSVNASGQFVGVAEMINNVDFDKSVEYWQQDKWTGCFSVKWLIVKDTPNSIFKHIILANNENKPVTNSRDTQEVKLEQGLEMLKIFKGHASKTCILDDFGFYEARQKIIQEKKAKQQQFNKKVDDKERMEAPRAPASVLVPASVPTFEEKIKAIEVLVKTMALNSKE